MENRTVAQNINDSGLPRNHAFILIFMAVCRPGPLWICVLRWHSSDIPNCRILYQHLSCVSVLSKRITFSQCASLDEGGSKIRPRPHGLISFMKIRFSLLALLLLFGCAHKNPAAPEVSGGTPVFPPTFRLSQHVLWQFQGKDIDFLCYAVRQKEGTLRVRAFAEMGGSIFDLTISPDKTMIHAKQEKMPSSVIKDGIGQDFLLLYSAKRPAYQKDSGFQIIAKTRNKTRTIIHFSGSPTKEGAWIPKRIVVHNLQFRYQMRIEILPGSCLSGDCGI